MIICKEGDRAQEHLWGYYTGKRFHACQRDNCMEWEEDNRDDRMDGE